MKRTFAPLLCFVVTLRIRLKGNGGCYGHSVKHMETRIGKEMSLQITDDNFWLHYRHHFGWFMKNKWLVMLAHPSTDRISQKLGVISQNLGLSCEKAALAREVATIFACPLFHFKEKYWPLVKKLFEITNQSAPFWSFTSRITHDQVGFLWIKFYQYFAHTASKQQNQSFSEMSSLCHQRRFEPPPHIHINCHAPMWIDASTVNN